MHIKRGKNAEEENSKRTISKKKGTTKFFKKEAHTEHTHTQETPDYRKRHKRGTIFNLLVNSCWMKMIKSPLFVG